MHVTKLLHRFNEGDREVMDLLIPLVYQELKKLARARLRNEMNVSPLETTALVHEVFLKLAVGSHPSYDNRSHFYGIASRLMRQILVDAARAKATAKRSGGQVLALDDLPDIGSHPDRSVLALEDALKWLENTDQLKGRLIEMRYFGGMTAEECASALSIPVHVVRRELRLAQAWLRKHMADGPLKAGTPPAEQSVRLAAQAVS